MFDYFVTGLWTCINIVFWIAFVMLIRRVYRLMKAREDAFRSSEEADSSER